MIARLVALLQRIFRPDYRLPYDAWPRGDLLTGMPWPQVKHDE